MNAITNITAKAELLPHEAERNPVVFTRNGEVFTSSRAVAEYFDKRHDNVMRDIAKLLKMDTSLGLLNFEETPYVDATNGQTYKSYDMDRQGFELLAMGFTGPKALKWKIAYVRAFAAMEQQLRQPNVIDFSDPKIALGFIEHLSSQVKEKDAVIEEQGGRLKKLDRIEGAIGSMCITDAAKTLSISRAQSLFEFMSGRRWIFKRPGNKNWLAYNDKIQSGYLEHTDHMYMDGLGQERVSTRVLVTAKGLVKLAELLEQPLH